MCRLYTVTKDNDVVQRLQEIVNLGDETKLGEHKQQFKTVQIECKVNVTEMCRKAIPSLSQRFKRENRIQIWVE